MKKAVILLLAVLYVTITSGVVVNIHYCMGEFAGVNYGHQEDNNCGKCGMEQKDGCCKTEHKIIKADQEHLFVKTFSEINSGTAEIPAFFALHNPSAYKGRDHLYTHYHSPPDHRGTELSVYNCVFMI